MLSRFILTFLPWSKHLLISWLQSLSAVILEPKKIVSQCFHRFSIYLPWSDGTRSMIFIFGMLSFSLFSFTFIKRLFSSSLPSAISVVSSAYLRLLIFLPEILIPTCASTSLAFPMMYSANKQCDNIQPWHTSFPILNQSVVPCLVLTFTPWPVYRLLRTWVRWSDSPIFTGLFPLSPYPDIVPLQR